MLIRTNFVWSGCTLFWSGHTCSDHDTQCVDQDARVLIRTLGLGVWHKWKAWVWVYAFNYVTGTTEHVQIWNDILDQGQRCKGRHAKPGMLLWGTIAAHLHVVFPGCRHVSTARRLQNKQALGACACANVGGSELGARAADFSICTCANVRGIYWAWGTSSWF